MIMPTRSRRVGLSSEEILFEDYFLYVAILAHVLSSSDDLGKRGGGMCRLDCSMQ